MNHDDEMTSADMLSPDEIREHDQAVEALLDARADEQAAEHATSWPDDDEPWDGFADGEER